MSKFTLVHLILTSLSCPSDKAETLDMHTITQTDAYLCRVTDTYQDFLSHYALITIDKRKIKRK